MELNDAMKAKDLYYIEPGWGLEGSVPADVAKFICIGT